MKAHPHSLAIDARPRGPDGPYASLRVLGQTVLEGHVETALRVQDGPVVIIADHHEDQLVNEYAGQIRVLFHKGQVGGYATTLRTDRLYDPRRLRRALRRGRDPEIAAIWRLDGPGGSTAAEAEIVRRRTYQPLGKYWSLGPAKALARALAPSVVRPNAVTLAAGLLMAGAALMVARGGPGWIVALCLALALVLDTADGHLARLQGTASEFGRWLDEVLDETADMALHAAISWAAFVASANAAWLALGMAYGMGKYLFRVVTATREEAPATACVPARTSPWRSIVRLIGHADVRWHAWIILAALGRLELALLVYAAYFPARALLVFAGKAVRRG